MNRRLISPIDPDRLYKLIEVVMPSNENPTGYGWLPFEYRKALRLANKSKSGLKVRIEQGVIKRYGIWGRDIIKFLNQEVVNVR